MLADLIGSGVEARVRVTCIEARGLRGEDLLDGAEIGKMLDLARWVEEGSKILNF
jgi:sulfur relay (sulfurtransferase) complex TusBCD TusD component (DsrE family)